MPKACPAPLTRYASTDGRTGHEHGSLMLLHVGKSENIVWSTRQCVEENLIHTAVLSKFPHSNCCKQNRNRPLRPRICNEVPNRPLRPHGGRFETLLGQLQCGSFGRTAVRRHAPANKLQECLGISTEGPHSIADTTFERGCQVSSIHVALPCVLHGPWSYWSAGGRFAKATASSQATAQARSESEYPELHDASAPLPFSLSVAAQRRRCWHCFLSAGAQPATLRESHS